VLGLAVEWLFLGSRGLAVGEILQDRTENVASRSPRQGLPALAPACSVIR
jgi:hypothetical protein